MIRILVVEDEEPLRMALVDALRAESFEVLEAGDGEAGPFRLSIGSVRSRGASRRQSSRPVVRSRAKV